MLEKDYDGIIAEHYRKAAEKDGLEPSSTMADMITREKETKAILQFVKEALVRRREAQLSEPAVIMDIGCGNGYTLEVLHQKHPNQVFIGVEKTKALRELAISRFSDTDNISIVEGDIREGNFSSGSTADVLICQRVIINLLSLEDQREALQNIIEVVQKPGKDKLGGVLLFIEAFVSPLVALNEARDEFGIAKMEPAHHNLYLPDDFFNSPELKPYLGDNLSPSNFLSTHYFVTRVLHQILLGERPFKRNSEFVNFFSQALNDGIGDYSPLKLFHFEKVPLQ